MRHLNDVKPGDKITVRWNGIDRFLTVTEAGKLKIKASDGTVWKRSGYEWGKSNYHGPWISCFEDSDREELERQNAERKRLKMAYELRDARWRDLPFPIIKAAHAVVFPELDETK